MSRIGTLALGAITAWPALYYILFLAMIVAAMINPRILSDEDLVFVFLAHVLTIVLNIGLLVFYIAHAYRSKQLDDNKRILWTMLLFFGSVVAMPVYWYVYIWPDSARQPNERKEPESAQEQ